MGSRGLAALVLGAALGLIASLHACGQQSPEPHFQQLRSRDAAERTKAANALLRYGEAVVPRLIKESGSGYIRVRFEVVKLMGRIKDRRAVPVLIERLDDPSVNVAQAAAWALAEMRDPAALPALLRFSRDAAKGVRKEVMRGLGYCSVGADSAAVPAGGIEPSLVDSAYREIVQALRDPVPEVRITALLAVREFGYRGVHEQVIRMSRDPAAEVRHVAVQAMGQIAAGQVDGGEEVSPRTRDNIFEALVAALDEPYQTIRTKAVRALGDVGQARARPHLERLHSQGGEEDRREAGRALDKLAAQ